MPCLLKCILIQSAIRVVLTRLECNRTRFEEACGDIQQRLSEFDVKCHTYICVNENYFFILEYLSNESVISMPRINCASQRWYHSPDGGPSYTLLNSSSSKYLIQNNDLLLNFGDVSASDEGIYGCLDSVNHRSYPKLCVQVYGELCPYSSYNNYNGDANHRGGEPSLTDSEYM